MYFFLFLSLFCPFLLSDEAWKNHKHSTILQMQEFSNTCPEEMLDLVMDVVQQQCVCCVGVGVYKGEILFPIAQALKFSGKGKIYGIETWKAFDRLIENGWWSFDNQKRLSGDLSKARAEFYSLLSKNQLGKYVEILCQTPEKALLQLSSLTIDFLYADAQQGEKQLYQTLISFFLKVKDEGYILLRISDAWKSMRSLIFLLERCERLSQFSASSSYVLFQKKKEKEMSARCLMHSF